MELIQISERNGKQVVSARELHNFLESKKQFADWIKHRIKKYGLIENVDFQPLSLNGENGGKSNEFALTLDDAKELSMVEGNAQGKKARLYFIECEKKTVKIPTPIEISQMFIESEQEKERQRLRAERAETVVALQSAELKQAAPVLEFAAEVLSSTSAHNINQIAKDYGMSAVSFNKMLRDRGVQYKQGDQWLLYSKYQGKGYTKSSTHPYVDAHGTVKTKLRTVWTQLGRQFLHGLIKKPLAITA